MKRLIYIFLVLGVMSSCKSKKIATENSRVGNANFYQVLENDLKFELLKVNGTINVENSKQKIGAQFSMRIKSDSLIWLSFRVAFIEAYRMQISKDSVWLMDRLKRQHKAESIEYLGQLIGTNIGYEWLEGILLANVKPMEGMNFTRVMEDNKQYLKSREDELDISLITNAALKKLELLKLLLATSDSDLLVEFPEYKDIDGTIFPSKTSFTIQNPQFAHAEIKYGKFSLPSDLSFPFSIPSSYSAMP